jgi:hypothetical protein
MRNESFRSGMYTTLELSRELLVMVHLTLHGQDVTAEPGNILTASGEDPSGYRARAAPPEYLAAGQEIILVHQRRGRTGLPRADLTFNSSVSLTGSGWDALLTPG